MARLHLIELEDQAWVPALLRDLATDVLQFNQTMVDQIAPVVAKITQALETTGSAQIVDLCSGASGPLLKLTEHLEEGGVGVPVVDGAASITLAPPSAVVLRQVNKQHVRIGRHADRTRQRVVGEARKNLGVG